MGVNPHRQKPENPNKAAPGQHCGTNKTKNMLSEKTNETFN